jgi:hypothetical protein
MTTLILLVNLGLQCSLTWLSSGQQMPPGSQQSRPAVNRQLMAVRGEITQIAAAGTGVLSITVRPEAGFATVTVTARENDPVGPAVAHESEFDLLDLLTGEDASEDAQITAAELHKGDVVSVIYDPQTRNRALEIYLH